MERLRSQVATLELAVEGRLVNLPAQTLLGRLLGAGTVEKIPASTFATPEQVSAAIAALLGGATQSTLDTIQELGAALGGDANFATTVANSLAAKVDRLGDVTIDGKKVFLKLIKVPYLEEDISLSIATGINWIANTWYAIPGLIIPYAFGEVRSWHLTVNYQYSDGSNSPSHWQMGGNCSLPGGSGWNASGAGAEVTLMLQHHNGADTNSLTFRSALGGANRGLEIKPNFNITIDGLGFISFALKRFR